MVSSKSAMVLIGSQLLLLLILAESCLGSNAFTLLPKPPVDMSPRPGPRAGMGNFQEQYPKPSLWASRSEKLLYLKVFDELYYLDVTQKPRAWKRIPIPSVHSLITNAQKVLYACCISDAVSTWYRIQETSFTKVASHASSEVGNRKWYIDGKERIWTWSPEELLVLSKGKEPWVLKSQLPRHPSEPRAVPCEWKPGHVAFLFNFHLVVANAEAIKTKRNHILTREGNGKGPFRLGNDRLVAAPGRTKKMYLLNPRDIDSPPTPFDLPWRDFTPILDSPNGRILMRGEEPKTHADVLFWCEPDGATITPVKRGHHILSEGLSHPYVFDKQGRCYGFLGANLVRFHENAAFRITPYQGLPFYCRSMAACGPWLGLVGQNYRMALLDTTATLPRVPPPTGSWQSTIQVTGPCCIDFRGHLWAFLADFPDRISRFDGETWTHIRLPKEGLVPRSLMADDLGNLLVVFQSGEQGMVRNGQVRLWKKWAYQAWFESMKLGASRFFDGSAFSTHHQAYPGGILWLGQGEIYWNVADQVRYQGGPHGQIFWFDSKGNFYRAQHNQAWCFRNGRWYTLKVRPSRMLLGPRGLQSFEQNLLDSLPSQYTEIQCSRGYQLFATGIKPPKGASLYLINGVSYGAPLRGNETYVPISSGGGWLGSWRRFQGAYLHLNLKGKVFETPFGRFFYDERSKVIFCHKPRYLKLSSSTERLASEWRVTVKVQAKPAPLNPRIIVFVNGVPQQKLQRPGVISFPFSKFEGAKLELWAIDDWGDASAQPIAVRIGSQPSDASAVPITKPGALWNVMGNKVVTSGKSLTLGRSLAIDGKGNVYLAASPGKRQQPVLLMWNEGKRRWNIIPGVHPVALSASPDGRVWAMEESANRSNRMERPFRGISPEGGRPGTHIYGDRHNNPIYGWDRQNRLWNVGMRWIGCWDGTDWRNWERPVGFKAVLIFSAGGLSATLSQHGIWVGRDGLLEDTIVLSDGWRSKLPAFFLGEDHLVLKVRKVIDRATSRETWGLYSLSKGTLNVERWPDHLDFLPDTAGNLYLWNYKTQKMRIVSGQDLTETEVPYVRAPHVSWGSHDKTFLSLKSGEWLFASVDVGVTTWTRTKGPQVYGWDTGLQRCRTLTMQEDSKGRAWIRSELQLAVYNPSGAAKEKTNRFPGWESIPVSHMCKPCPGAGNSLWYWEPDVKTLVCFDGVHKKKWKVEHKTAPVLYGSVSVVSDQGEAIAGYHASLRHFRKDGTHSSCLHTYAGIVEMVKNGATRFYTPRHTPPPVLSPDGRIYFHERIWNGSKWVRTEEGRAFLSQEGELLLIKGPEYMGAEIYRFKGVKLERIGRSSKYLADFAGRRLYEDKLAGGEAGRRFLTVLDDLKNEKTRVALLGKDRPSYPIYFITGAVPDRRGGLFITSTFDTLHHLTPKGLHKLSVKHLPFGKVFPQPFHLGKGKLAFAVGKMIFICSAGHEFKYQNK